jgi:hypothetical protein
MSYTPKEDGDPVRKILMNPWTVGIGFMTIEYLVKDYSDDLYARLAELIEFLGALTERISP